MQAANDVNFRRARFRRPDRLGSNVFQRMLVSAGLFALLAIETAELAGKGTNVGVIEVTVDVVLREITVQAPAD
jgi:hypothetical protein